MKLKQLMLAPVALEPQQALELLLEKMKGTKSNVEFLLQIQKTTIGGDAPAAGATANKESVEA